MATLAAVPESWPRALALSPDSAQPSSPAIKDTGDPRGMVEPPEESGSYQETRLACSHSDWDTGWYGNSVISVRDEETLQRLGLCGFSLLAWDQQNGPSHQNEKPHSPSATAGSPRHIFWVVPAFHVAYLKQFKPLTPREKFDEWLQSTYDPRGLALYAAESASLEHSSSDGFCGYGHGWGGYGKCFASMEADANISSFFGDYLFPVIMHQDPRYFRLGQGPVGKRLFYAVSRVFIAHSDSGHWVFDSSALSGSVLAAAASNLYYPRSDRGFYPSLDRFGIDLGDTAAFNIAAEFWPDIQNKLHRVF